MRSVILDPGGDKFGEQVLVASYLAVAEVEETDAQLLLDLLAHLLLPQLVEELVGQGLRRVESLLWSVYHELREQVQQQRVGFREDLGKGGGTSFQSRFFTLGNL